MGSKCSRMTATDTDGRPPKPQVTGSNPVVVVRQRLEYLNPSASMTGGHVGGSAIEGLRFALATRKRAALGGDSFNQPTDETGRNCSTLSSHP